MRKKFSRPRSPLLHGNIAVTLAHLRFDEPVENQTPKVRRIVTFRLMLTNSAAGQLLQQLQRLTAQFEACDQIPN
jgi:hypothetical protein